MSNKKTTLSINAKKGVNSDDIKKASLKKFTFKKSSLSPMTSMRKVILLSLISKHTDDEIWCVTACMWLALEKTETIKKVWAKGLSEARECIAEWLDSLELTNKDFTDFFTIGGEYLQNSELLAPQEDTKKK